MTTPHAPNLCLSCTHLDRSLASTGYNSTPRCPAFPGGIPSDIFNHGADHRAVDRRQEGSVTYEPQDGLGFMYEEWWDWARTQGVA